MAHERAEGEAVTDYRQILADLVAARDAERIANGKIGSESWSEWGESTRVLDEKVAAAKLLLAANAPPAAEPENDGGIRKALSKASRRVVAQQQVIDSLLEKQGGLRHRIKTLQSLISRIKPKPTDGQQVTEATDATRPPQGAADGLSSRGQDQAPSGARGVGLRGDSVSAQRVESGSVVEPKGDRTAAETNRADLCRTVDSLIEQFGTVPDESMWMPGFPERVRAVKDALAADRRTAGSLNGELIAERAENTKLRAEIGVLESQPSVEDVTRKLDEALAALAACKAAPTPVEIEEWRKNATYHRSERPIGDHVKILGWLLDDYEIDDAVALMKRAAHAAASQPAGGVIPLTLDTGQVLTVPMIAGGAHKDARADGMPAFLDLNRSGDMGPGTTLRYVPEATASQPARAFTVLHAAVRESLVGFQPDATGMGTAWFGISRENAMKLLRLATVDVEKAKEPAQPAPAAPAVDDEAIEKAILDLRDRAFEGGKKEVDALLLPEPVIDAFNHLRATIRARLAAAPVPAAAVPQPQKPEATRAVLERLKRRADGPGTLGDFVGWVNAELANLDKPAPLQADANAQKLAEVTRERDGAVKASTHWMRRTHENNGEIVKLVRDLAAARADANAVAVRELRERFYKRSWTGVDQLDKKIEARIAALSAPAEAASAPAPAPVSGEGAVDALGEVAAEREKQRRKWGYGHDDEHDDKSLVKAALSLVNEYLGVATMHPWQLPQKHKEPRDRLRIAAALIVAEMERLSRSELARREGKS